LQSLSGCEGILSDEQLRLFTSNGLCFQEYFGNICFNGPLDTVKHIFYPHNFFAGNGRYISRYLVDKAGNRRRRVISEEGALDVQIVPPYDDSRFYVAAILPTGCGFDARYRHAFDHWIDPAAVMVESRKGHIIYREAGSGQVLRFHFFGFFLGQYLRPEYQLMLAAHADFFLNPFERSVSQGEEIQHVPGLCYRSVCLRREQWRFAKKMFEPAWKHNDILCSTIALREILREAGVSFESAYFELHHSTISWRKPRYVEICNPLSVHAFRRAVRSSFDDTIISIARMEPPAKNGSRGEKCPHIMELMIEA
jgi:hypothetical protein